MLSRIGTKAFEIAVSVPLVLEYEDALLRHRQESGLSEGEIGAILDYICKTAVRQEIFFLWRPTLRDPKDDMVLELAVAAEAVAIVTHNTRDFGAAPDFGVRVLTPQHLLETLKGNS